ncbi:uncharacterized protein LOC143900299 [Temnothorax americanus]|uniref:uncharacterized protein LOC143900299 n=1 Tax=Temnothorax americanus TaxID=1964332 RepID=UPI00406973A9
MFYPIDLLSRRRRGKLAPCWLAATVSEKLFKSHYNSSAIKKINTVETCEQILEILQLRNRSDRFSLYLSSQLMCGVTRIHRLHVVYYQKEVFEMQKKFDSGGGSGGRGRGGGRGGGGGGLNKEDDAVQDLELRAIDVPISTQDFPNAQLEIDLHLLSDEEFDDRLRTIVKDAACCDFGALNDEELDFMLKHDFNLSLDRMDELRTAKERSAFSKKTADDITIEEIQEKQLSQETSGPVLVDISERKKSKEGPLLTPQKRQPREMQVETPMKRRRLFSDTASPTDVPLVEDVAVPPAPVEDVVVPAELPREETRMLVLPQQEETGMELESLDSSYFVIRSHSKKSKIIDQNKVLSDKQLQKWRQNVNIHCKKLDKPLTKNLSLTPAINLFNQPSDSPRRWNKSLRSRFAARITGPFKSVNEDVALAECTQFFEKMRVEETVSRLDLPTEEVSTFQKTEMAIAAEPGDSVANVLTVTNIIHETMDVSMVPLPKEVPEAIVLEEGTSIVEQRPDQEEMNISNDECFEDVNILLERQRQSPKTAKHIPPVPSTSSLSGHSQPALTSQEILVLLQVFWRDKLAVKFSELIPPDTYSREDAATAFEILLDLYAQEKLILEQTDCSEPLWIVKYND